MSRNSTNLFAPICILAACLFALTVLATYLWNRPYGLSHHQPRPRRAVSQMDQLVSSLEPVSDVPLIHMEPQWNDLLSTKELALLKELNRQSRTPFEGVSFGQQHATILPAYAESRYRPAPQPLATSSVEAPATLRICRAPRRTAGAGVAIDIVQDRDFQESQVVQLRASGHDVLSVWPYPKDLLRRLEALTCYESVNPIVADVRAAIDQLRACEDFVDPVAADALRRLATASDQMDRLATASIDPSFQVDVLSCQYALHKRAKLWQQVYDLATTSPKHALARRPDPENLVRRVSVARDVVLHEAPNAGWGDYLLLHDATACLGDCGEINARELAELSRRMLSQIRSPHLNASQKKYLNRDEIRLLTEELQHWARQPIDYQRMLAQVEQYEDRDSYTRASNVADYRNIAEWTTLETTAALGTTIENHYRNANVRVAVSEDLLNRLVPETTKLTNPVRDQVLGADVRGHSHTTARLRVELDPNPSEWRVGIMASGCVVSNTASEKWPARFYMRGASSFRAAKSVSVTPHGVVAPPSRASVNAGNRLTGMETEFDTLPLFGDVVRSMARRQHESNASRLREITRSKVAYSASRRLDQTIQEKITVADTDFQKKVLTPLQRLHLDPVAIQMETTDERLVARYRIAGENQLGSHTPRPRAYSDSLLSVQIHESAINNLLEQLKLDGRKTIADRLVERPADDFRRQRTECSGRIAERR